MDGHVWSWFMDRWYYHTLIFLLYDIWPCWGGSMAMYNIIGWYIEMHNDSVYIYTIMMVYLYSYQRGRWKTMFEYHSYWSWNMERWWMIAGWWYTYPSEKYFCSSVGMMKLLNLNGKVNNLPNHQPDNYYRNKLSSLRCIKCTWHMMISIDFRIIGWLDHPPSQHFVIWNSSTLFHVVKTSHGES